MSTYQQHSTDTGNRVEHHLQAALAVSTHDEALYHVREAAQLQLFENESAKPTDLDTILLAN